jgi:chaperonin GroES
MDLTPLGDRLIVKPVEAEQTTASGIVLPDTAKEKSEWGEVLAIGEGKLMDDGTRVTPNVAVGDKVLYGKYGGNEINYQGDDLVVLRGDEIFAKQSS